MDVILPCCRAFLDLFIASKQNNQKQMFKRFSNAQEAPTADQKSIAELSEAIPNDYTQIKGANIFVTPSVDDETIDESNPGNLLINKCQNGSFIIMRSLQNVYIDSCSDCFIFLGPCRSTLFIRNCKNMRIRAISQQLRIENSQNIMVEAIVGVKPVLESCRGIKLSSLSCKMYQDLVWQIEKANIDLFKNQIYQCYDFTPKKIPNFINSETQDFEEDAQWQAKIELNDLDWEYKNVYLPQIVLAKNSLLPKMYSQTQIRQNNKIFIIFTRMSLKQLLNCLNQPSLCRNLHIIKKLEQQSCIKLLKNEPAYRQKIKAINEKQGKWHFLFVKTKNKLNSYEIGLPIIQDRDLVCKLFKNCSAF